MLYRKRRRSLFPPFTSSLLSLNNLTEWTVSHLYLYLCDLSPFPQSLTFRIIFHLFRLIDSCLNTFTIVTFIRFSQWISHMNYTILLFYLHLFHSSSLFQWSILSILFPSLLFFSPSLYGQYKYSARYLSD